MAVSKCDLRDIESRCDQWIRESKIHAAKELLLGLVLKDIPRKSAQSIAHLHFRTGLFLRALEILTPIVRPKSGLQLAATPLELATHAICLIKIGSVDEGIRELQGLRGQIAQADLYLAFAAQAQWDYKSAIPHLRNYLGRGDTTEYDRAVARVNLAAALIDTRQLLEAEAVLADLYPLLIKNQWGLLIKNVYELRGQLAVWHDDLGVAREHLEKAQTESNRDDDLWDLFVAKWHAVIQVRRNPDMSAAGNLQKVRSRAAKLGHWESVRECDRYLASATHNTDLLCRLYFGTPFHAYRQTIEKEAQGWAQIPESYIFGSPDHLVFDLKTASDAEGKVSLKAGQVMHIGLRTLASDRYRPLFMGHMYATLFPGEFFNPLSAPNRVANITKRLRQWIKAAGLPLQIDVRGQFHSLVQKNSENFGLRYSRDEGLTGEVLGLEVNLIKLKAAVDRTGFSSVEAAAQLQMSKATVLKVLNWGVAVGKLEKAGANRNTKYKFAS